MEHNLCPLISSTAVTGTGAAAGTEKQYNLLSDITNIRPSSSNKSCEYDADFYGYNISLLSEFKSWQIVRKI